MPRSLSSILVTGGAGFIGGNFIRTLLSRTPGFAGRIVNCDALTYAGNPASLEDVEREWGGRRYFLERGDIGDRQRLESVFRTYGIDTVVHFAAESHVDRSILGPETFIRTNVLGTYTLLETARASWKNEDGSLRDDVLFHHVSTDEVYGSLGETGRFRETTPYDPRSPYSASKASSDHLVRAWGHTYGLPYTLSNCSNNYGPFQFPEKLIPVIILNLLEGKKLPVYGQGKNVRDWIFVDDHNDAVWTILERGRTGESYNIGGETEKENIALVRELCVLTARKTGADPEEYLSRITFVPDRPGHDLRYAIDCSKVKNELGWRQKVGFERGLDITVQWYLDNRSWIESVRTGEYRDWIERNYGHRTG